MKEVVAFVCDFCPRKKRFAQRGTARNHEERCFYNPARRACVTCKHFTMVPGEPSDPETGYYFHGGPECDLGIIPIDMGPEEPAKIMTADCEKWEPMEEHRNG